MPQDADLSQLFGFDPPGRAHVGRLGWCEPAFVPAYTEEVLSREGHHEIIRDSAGRTVKMYQGKRHGFMPTYLKHAVTNEKDWEEEVAPRLSPQTAERWNGFQEELERFSECQRSGDFIAQACIGGYMYLRALVGPMEICYLFADCPQLVHKMMRAWLDLADAVICRAQEKIEFDELFLAEDICYNHGLLISPDMVRCFLFPYYQELLLRMRSRQQRVLHFHVDTDGCIEEALPLYKEMGLTAMSPFEVAAQNDVLAIAESYPDLVMSGGIDKRVLATNPTTIDRYLEDLIPAMVKRGGFIPTCDHGVPDNVPFANYMHYRKRILELDH